MLKQVKFGAWPLGLGIESVIKAPESFLEALIKIDHIDYEHYQA